MTLDDRSSAVFGLVLGERRITVGPADVRVARQDNADGHEWVGSHDGYRRAFGTIHTRRLLLARNGSQLAGEDSFSAPTALASLPAIARFHLHPNVKPSLIRDGEGALLALPSGEIWAFEASGLRVGLEESIFFAAADGRHKTVQLVIEFDAVATPQIIWRFARLGTPAQRPPRSEVAERERGEAEPDLPL